MFETARYGKERVCKNVAGSGAMVAVIGVFCGKGVIGMFSKKTVSEKSLTSAESTLRTARKYWRPGVIGALSGRSVETPIMLFWGIGGQTGSGGDSPCGRPNGL